VIMADQQGPAAAIRDLLARRPAETAAAATGAVGLLLSVFIDDSSSELRTALVVLLSLLPATVSRLHDLAKYGTDGRMVAHDVAKELDEYALRAVRRARLGDESWRADLDKIKTVHEVASRLHPDPKGGGAGQASTGESAQDNAAATSDASGGGGTG
jgi:hypothetical protein